MSVEHDFTPNLPGSRIGERDEAYAHVLESIVRDDIWHTLTFCNWSSTNVPTTLHVGLQICSPVKFFVLPDFFLQKRKEKKKEFLAARTIVSIVLIMQMI
eukprot:c10517_g1_i1 orf=79-378(-)